MSTKTRHTGHQHRPLSGAGAFWQGRTARRLAVALALLAVPRLEAGEIRIAFPDRPGTLEIIDTFMMGATEYMNAADLARAFAIGSYSNKEVDKKILYFQDSEVKITAFSSFVVVDDKAFQMTQPSYFDGQNIYLPVRSFFHVLSLSVLPGSVYHKTAGHLPAQRLVGLSTFMARRSTTKRTGPSSG